MAVVFVPKKGQDEAWCYQILNLHGIKAFVVRVLQFCAHEINRGARGCDEEDFHGLVVERDVINEQIEVARAENRQKKALRFERYSMAILVFVQHVQQRYNAGQMQQVCDELKDVHPVICK